MKKYRGVFWNILGSSMYGINSFIMLAMVSRFGTIEQTGSFGIAFTTAQILYIIGLFGVSHYQMTDYQEKYSFKVYSEVRGITIGIMVIGCIIAVTCMNFSGEKLIYTISLTGLMVLNVIGDLYQNLFFQKNRIDLSGASLFYRTFWSLITFCVVLVFFESVFVAIIIQIVVNLIVTLYYIIKIAPEFIDSKFLVENHHATKIKDLMIECFPLFISILLMNLYINASKYGIEFLLDDTTQGYYNMIFMPAQVINLCSQFIFKPMLNRYAFLLSKRKIKEFYKLLQKQIILILLFTLGCCAVAYLIGISILEFVYRKDLSSFAISLVIVVLGGGFFAICQLCYYVFVILRKQKTILEIYLIMIIFTIGITYVLIQYMEINGAAISFVLVHVGLLLCYVLVMNRMMYKKQYLSLNDCEES